MNENSKYLTFTSQINDPVWGAVLTTKLEEKLLGTWELGRLEHVKQMGLAFLDFPGLTHTRLEHSLGVMYVADRIFTTLRDTASGLVEESLLGSGEFDKLFNPRTRQAVRLAALMHDLGHPPFSHAVELTFVRYPGLLDSIKGCQEIEPDQRQLFAAYSHETFTRWIIQRADGDVRRVLEENGFGDLVDEIANLAVGEAAGDLALFNTIISGDFDADRIDYLIRDNRHSGFSIGLSPDELYKSIHLRRTQVDGKSAFEIYIDKDALHFVNSVLSARNRLISRVQLAAPGRAATQMLNRFLYEDLVDLGDPARLAKIIVNLHTKCTDFTFYSQVTSHVRIGRAGRGTPAPPRDMFYELLQAPLKKHVWRQYAQLGFMRMNPCLRLLVYVCAVAKYRSPSELVIRGPEGQLLFLEPSTRPVPKFSLRVDFECDPGFPEFDFIGTTENRPGRAVLMQGMSNLDVFAYEMESGAQEVVGEAAASWTAGDEELLFGLEREDERVLARHVLTLAKALRSRAGEELLTPEFLLVILYFLSAHVAQSFRGARAIYVFSAESFINAFLDRVAGEAEPSLPIPKELVKEGRINANRVFSEIQRLNVFGLIETRQRPTYHSPIPRGENGEGRTRNRVFSTREHFRISHWGMHYVETQLASRVKDVVCGEIVRRQERVRTLLLKMAQVIPRDHEWRKEDGSRIEMLKGFFEGSAEIVKEIGTKGGCVMTFRLPDVEGKA